MRSAVAGVSFAVRRGTVTGSKYTVRDSGRAVLLDCGLFQRVKALWLSNRHTASACGVEAYLPPPSRRESESPRSRSLALTATITVLAAMNTAPTAGERKNPSPAVRPAASGMATAL